MYHYVLVPISFKLLNVILGRRLKDIQYKLMEEVTYILKHKSMANGTRLLSDI